MIDLPILLDSNLAEVRRLRPLALSAEFSMREAHSAELTLAESDEYTRAGLRTDAVKLHSVILIRMPNGAVWVYRVTGIDRTIRGEIRYTLTHLIDTLRDDVWREKSSSRGYLSAFLTKLLGFQTVSYWTLGTNQLAQQTKWYRDDCDYTKLSDLFGEVRDAFTQHYFSYSHTMTGGVLTANTVSVFNLPTTPGAEFRLSRNVSKCSFERDDSEMCNHLYIKWHPRSSDYYYVREFTDAASIAQYGEVQKAEELSTDDIESSDYTTYAAQYLERYARPTLTVSIDGMELKRLTGQAWDELAIGKLVRVALPDYGESYEERCVTVSYPDLLGTPERITVELGDHAEKLTEITSNTKKKTSGRVGQYLYGQSGNIAEEENNG